MVYQGVIGYRIKPPKGFGRNVMTEARLRELLGKIRVSGRHYGNHQRFFPLIEHTHRIRSGRKAVAERLRR